VNPNLLSQSGPPDPTGGTEQLSAPSTWTLPARSCPYYLIPPQGKADSAAIETPPEPPPPAPAPSVAKKKIPMPAPPHEAGDTFAPVDVAIVAESTYPFLKGGVSAVVHDIITNNQDLTFGILHIAWDSGQPAEDLYGVPDNVLWVRTQYLSMQEHEADFRKLQPGVLRMRRGERRELSDRVFDALDAILLGNPEAMWQLYDEGMNPRTRKYPLWGLLGTEEFMAASRNRLPKLDLPLTDTFWLLREFFSLACAVVGEDFPLAKVYHAHTTGYAALLAAAGARQNGTRFLLTEHNLYVRDTINTLLDRSMALTVSERDWRDFEDITPVQRAWMAWWIEMGRFCYPSTEAITYLYPLAIAEAADLGSPIERSTIIPNGIKIREFDGVYAQRQAVWGEIWPPKPERIWKLVYIARVVPIKGLAFLIESLAMLIERGVTNFHLDILGPTDHAPDYFMLCRERARELRVEDYITFRGVVNVREMLGEFDVLVLPSLNEGQPVVVLEAMTAGVPTVGTEVGGMAQLIVDPLTTPGGRTFGPAGVLMAADEHLPVSMANALYSFLQNPSGYEEMARNARGRVENFFQLEDAMGAYNRLYKELAGIPINELESASDMPQVIDLTDAALAKVPKQDHPMASDSEESVIAPMPYWPRLRYTGGRE
jgi:glycosyltransferase involved in cell wall biosynthesis